MPKIFGHKVLIQNFVENFENIRVDLTNSNIKVGSHAVSFTLAKILALYNLKMVI